MMFATQNPTLDTLEQSNLKIKQFVTVINQLFVEGYGRRTTKKFRTNRRKIKKTAFLRGVKPEIFNLIPEPFKNPNNDVNWKDLIEIAQDIELLLNLRKVVPSSPVDPKFRNSFSIDEDGYVIVYTDGACLDNGLSNPKAGIGVWFGDEHHLNNGRPLRAKYNATSNVAEIQAVTLALTILKKEGVQRVKVMTDSQFLINCMTDWVFGWLVNGWLKADDESPVTHKAELRQLLLKMEDMFVKWVHVKAHDGNHGNEMADKLASQGAKRYRF